MLKRRLPTLAIVVYLVLLSSPVAYADIIYEPENDFYVKHRSYMVYLNRSFTANGESGDVALKTSPGSDSEVYPLRNGSTTHIQYSCLYNGEYWGYSPELSGWLKLDQMLVLYDYVSFNEDHFDEFYAYKGDCEKITESGGAIVWPWPGAKTPLWTFEGLDVDHYDISTAYIDSEGREWGFAEYIYGYRNIWICLSDPLNLNLPALTPAPEPAVWVSETVHVNIAAAENALDNVSPTLIVIIALVAVIVAATAILIRAFWKDD